MVLYIVAQISLLAKLNGKASSLAGNGFTYLLLNNINN